MAAAVGLRSASGQSLVSADGEGVRARGSLARLEDWSWDCDDVTDRGVGLSAQYGVHRVAAGGTGAERHATAPPATVLRSGGGVPVDRDRGGDAARRRGQARVVRRAGGAGPVC